MRLHIVYSGRLSASGNSSKPEEAKLIRDEIHPQLKMLWASDVALRRLRKTAVVAEQPGRWIPGSLSSPFESDHDPNEPIREGFVDLCQPIVREGKSFIPLVRKSLDLNCSLSILFLRKEDPGQLIKQAGDIDNRIKTLFDGLRMPDLAEQRKNPPGQDETYCLLESDSLISGISVSTDRLLIPQSERLNEVHLVIEVEVRVLKLGSWNVCLVGG